MEHKRKKRKNDGWKPRKQYEWEQVKKEHKPVLAYCFDNFFSRL
jgi:hypothetical protein